MLYMVPNSVAYMFCICRLHEHCVHVMTAPVYVDAAHLMAAFRHAAQAAELPSSVCCVTTSLLKLAGEGRVQQDWKVALQSNMAYIRRLLQLLRSGTSSSVS